MRQQLPLIGFAFLLYIFFALTVTQQWFVPVESFSIMHGLLFTFNIAALTLALLFGRTTLFLLLLLFFSLALITESFDYLRHSDARTWIHTPVGTMIDFALDFLIPPLIALLSWFENRALFSRIGLSRLAIIFAANLFIVLWLFYPAMLPLSDMFNMNLYIFPNVGIPDPIQLVWYLSLGYLFVHIAVLKEAHKSIFFLALFGVLLASALPNTLDYFLLFSALFSLLSLFFIIANSYYMAYIDELTGIKGRRAMNEALIRLGNSYSIAMVDIDHFKKFNDTYGHDIGDEVLKLVAMEINKVSGGGDAFRWGGEEFAIIFNGKSAKDSFVFADKVRDAIEKHPFYLRSPDRPNEKPDNTVQAQAPKNVSKLETIYITVSMGIGEKTKEDLNAMDVMKKADDLLYVAKEAGRNCVKL